MTDAILKRLHDAGLLAGDGKPSSMTDRIIVGGSRNLMLNGNAIGYEEPFGIIVHKPEKNTGEIPVFATVMGVKERDNEADCNTLDEAVDFVLKTYRTRGSIP